MNAKELRSIKIKGFKSIRNQTVVLGKMNVLIGQNGAGKSNFISVFKFLRNIIEERLKVTSLRAGAENLMYYGSKETTRVSFQLDLKPNHYTVSLLPSEGDTLFVETESCGVDIDTDSGNAAEPSWAYIATMEAESRLAISRREKPYAEDVYNVLKDWRLYHFHDTSETAGFKKYGPVSDSKFLLEDASNLAAFLYVMKHSEAAHYDRIVKTIQLVIPFFRDFVLEPNPLNKETIRLEWMDKNSDRIFIANQLSDGSLRFICMAVLLLQKKLPRVILLDEPELGLHPSAMAVLSGLLQKASTRSQVILSTQSVSLVNEFDAEDIIVVERSEAETVFKRLDVEALTVWLDRYSLGDLWDKNVIGGKP